MGIDVAQDCNTESDGIIIGPEDVQKGTGVLFPDHINICAGEQRQFKNSHVHKHTRLKITYILGSNQQGDDKK